MVRTPKRAGKNLTQKTELPSRKISFEVHPVNGGTDLQIEILAQQLPSMNQRIEDAYKNTREFVNYIKKTLPAAKINFVS